MPKYWQSVSFRELEKEWDLKLKESGFVDAETTLKDERILIQNSPNAYRQAPRVVRENKEQYYTLLSYCMQFMPPKSRVERLIMYHLSLGAKIREISEVVRSIGGPCHRQTIRFIIRKYEHRWGLRAWSQAHLNPKWRSPKRAKTRIK